MPKIEYVNKKFRASSVEIITKANQIINLYAAQGYDLTLRQLYYQFVSRDYLPNTVQSYKNLGGIINDARLAGMIDWHAITDRTRNLASLLHFDDAAHRIKHATDAFRIDKWKTQTQYIEAWIEKEALAGVFEVVCQELDIPFFACRGYTSQSEMWSAAMRLRRKARDGKDCLILHFGDHDPSGIDMTRDITDRLDMFGANVCVERIALNMPQIEEYNPPPNPAKETDSRFEVYMANYGDESWELDALEPQVLSDLVRDKVSERLDQDAWDAALQEEREQHDLLRLVVQEWPNVVDYLADNEFQLIEDGD